MFNLPNQLLIKMQTGCGRRNRPALAGKNTLISLAVIRVSRAMNVWRQGHIAILLEKFKRRPRESNAPQVVQTAENPYDATRCRYFKAFSNWFACAQLYNSLVSCDDTLQEYFDAAARRLCPR